MATSAEIAFEQKLLSTFETFRREDARLVKETRLLLSARREILVRQRQEDGLALARGLAETVDSMLRAWLGSHEGTGGLAIVALGGYGRGELNPHSDVDVMVLYPRGSAPKAGELTGPLLAFLWDVGHVVGHSTRTLDECRAAMDHDLPTATAVLEGRFVAGSRALFRRFVTKVAEPWLAGNAEEFIEKKIAEARARHDFYGGSPLLAVPNVKESAGGLRDVHVAGWLALALSGRKDFAVYREAGLLDEESNAGLVRAYSAVHRVRNTLHALAGVKQDALDPSVRPEAAARLGFADGEGFSATERFMREYYRAAVPLHRFLARVVRFREGCPAGGSRRVLGPGLVEAGGEVYPAEEGAVRIPAEAVAAVTLVVERGFTPSPDLGDALAVAARRVDDAVRSDPATARTFLDLLRRPGAGAGLRALDASGFLAEYLPEYGRLSCLAREDPRHQYTVDEHTLRSVQALDELPEGHPAREELERVPRPDLLRLALLLHDVGKARGRGHVAAGAAMVPEATARLGLDEEEAGLVRFLVAEHLRMTGLIDRRAPADAAEELAAGIRDRNRLRCLYLITLADVKATGAGALSGWRDAQIRALYEAALARLSPRPSAPFAERVIREAGEDREVEVRAHLGGMGARYALEVEPARAVLHLDLVRRLEDEPAALAFLEAESHAEVWVGARDARGLFSRIVGVLSLHDLDIGAARAYTREDGVAIDGFFVTREGEAPPGEEEFWMEVTGSLRDAVEGRLDLEARMASRRRRFRPGGEPAPLPRPCGATASNRISGRFTVVEVTARDRPGILFDLARALFLAGLDIHHAIVATRGPLVLDTFYLTRSGGGRLREEALAPVLEKLDSLVRTEEERV